MTNAPNIVKQKGTTEAERYLARLCERSFLSLWSYPGVFRNQAMRASGHGKEICDLLVVFGDDLIIFSDKDCQFPDSGNLDQDWARWFRRAVLESADQVRGAERWIRENPNRVFVDRSCLQPLPVTLPDPSRLRIHRVVIAHNVARRCRELSGGSGSLVIFPSLTSLGNVSGPVAVPDFKEDIYENCERSLRKRSVNSRTAMPFVVGDLDPSKEFVHVFDDIGLDILLGELDTVCDFVTYLRERETFIRSGRLLWAAGEEELLAHYLTDVDGYATRSFYTPGDTESKVLIPEGEWDYLQKGSTWIARKRADKISYFWDRIIERFSGHILDGTSTAYPFADFTTQELAARAMAREPRFHRRILSAALGEFLQATTLNEVTARIVEQIGSESPTYIFLTVRPRTNEELQEYRMRRWAIGLAYLIEGKRKFGDSREVIVLATEPRDCAKWATEDLMYRNSSPLTAEELVRAKELGGNVGVLTSARKTSESIAIEYPIIRKASDGGNHPGQRKAKSSRNSLCLCGSGKKFKRCCLRK